MTGPQRPPPLRLVCCGGGTAGHVYPALALLDQWQPTPPRVRWLGSPDGMERDIVTGRGIPFAPVRAAAVRDRSPVETARNAVVIARGVGQALAVLRRARPEVVLTTGGYVTVPVAYAAALLRIPLVVFLPDIRPGLAVRAQARLAHRVAVGFPDAAARLPADRVVDTGYPLRPALLAADRGAARARLGLDDTLPTVLVYGGSRGARTLNDAVVERLEPLLERAQLLHVSGTLDEGRMRARAALLPGRLRARYHLFGFIGDGLVDALVAADLAVARAGASTLAELPAVGLPAVLVPGPFSDQDSNAAWLADRGGAVVVANDAVGDGRLADTVTGLLDDPARLTDMRAATHRLARRDAGRRLQQVIEEAAGR